MAQLIQARNQAIYLVAGLTALAVLAWRRIPASWVWVRRVLLAWLILSEWVLILKR